jgi:hypothetical protein
MMNLPARTLLVVVLFAVSGPITQAQAMPILTDPSAKSTDASAKLPVYDVASVKLNKSNDGMMLIMNRPDGFSCTNIPLKTLIANAYGIRQDLISGGPDWVDSTGSMSKPRSVGRTWTPSRN